MNLTTPHRASPDAKQIERLRQSWREGASREELRLRYGMSVARIRQFCADIPRPAPMKLKKSAPHVWRGL